MGSGTKLNFIQAQMATLISRRRGSDRDLGQEIGRNLSNDPGETLSDASAPNFDEKGIELYSSLIEIGRFDLMASIFPIIHKLLGKNFKECALDYFAATPPRHYNLNRAAEKFGLYLAEHCPKLIRRYPFLAELADYEWIELLVLEQVEADVSTKVKIKSKSADERNKTENISDGDAAQAAQFASLSPVLTSAIAARNYHFDIPAIALAIKEGEKLTVEAVKACAAPVGVIVFRDASTLEARFLEVGDVAMQLLQLMLDRPGISYGELLTTVCAGVSPEEAGALLTGSLVAIEEFKKFHLILEEV
ncbi:MAG: putative DNA-binding domain-containing protein [Cyanobacteria bacterium REEB67]|nr:putative DNA-binding domain-containing protein [Cyanobacteria bacterium REEB67]